MHCNDFSPNLAVSLQQLSGIDRAEPRLRVESLDAEVEHFLVERLEVIQVRTVAETDCVAKNLLGPAKPRGAKRCSVDIVAVSRRKAHC